MDALIECNEYDAQLASLQIEEEFKFVTDILYRNYFQQRGIKFWMFAERVFEDHLINWLEDETEVDPVNIKEGYHDNKCLKLVKNNSGLWSYNPADCAEENTNTSFICEKAISKNH